MAASGHNTNVSQDTPITIKISVNDSLKKLKLPLRDLGANILLDKLRHLLFVKPEQTVVFERFSDSAGGYITLDPNNAQVFKTLMRAAKAKLKLRLKATVTPMPVPQEAKEIVEAAEKPSQKTMEPVIVRSPVHQCSHRDSTAFDRRSIGSGIFQFREARASQQTLVENNEAPVPQPFLPADNLSGILSKDDAAKPAAAALGNAWSVYCNECDIAMDNIHFHCSICDGGDYDLCGNCVARGKVCPGEGHWLIKRLIKDGKFITSTTERIPSRPRRTSLSQPKVPQMPGTFAEEPKVEDTSVRTPTRTCNSCVVVLEESQFVTCAACEDFDLCVKCASTDKHGHHPAHAFKPATGGTILPLTTHKMLAPGRNVRHNAICDGCDKYIYGIRHKCLNCPDWDYCNDCVKSSRHTHPRHRFAAIYTPIADAQTSMIHHQGIFCDGPLCNKKTGSQGNIVGVRYKCAVCHDTDFCAACEAHPSNPHNRTHPMIKFKTAVRGVSITTQNEDKQGNMRVFGDRQQQAAQVESKSTFTGTIGVPQANAATQVQTVAEIKPTEQKKAAEARPMLMSVAKSMHEPSINSQLLNATFVRDTIPDGAVLQPGVRFTQVWTVRNPGPHAWPSGCSVRFVGGDNMLNIDPRHPSSISELNEAQESNVTGREIKAGEEVAFKVTLRAPEREGKGISYWRIKAADGTPFGHRLWCDVDVKKLDTPTPARAMLSPLPSLQSLLVPQANMNGNSPLYQHLGLTADQQQALQYQAYLQRHQEAQMSGGLQRSSGSTFSDEAVRAQSMQSRFNELLLAKQAQAQADQQTLAAGASTFQQALGPKQVLRPVSSVFGDKPSSSINARVAAMREHQARRREHIANAQRERPEFPSSASTPGYQSSDAEQTAADEARKDAARKRMEFLKDKILRSREAAASQPEIPPAPEAVEDVAQKDVKVEETTNAVEPKESAEQESVESSQMVFPKLEKESPSSSIYQSVGGSSKGKVAYVENEEGEVERSATPVTVPEQITSLVTEKSLEDFEADDDDLEVLSVYEGESDDGFLTDEEYDVLDASDTETIA